MIRLGAKVSGALTGQFIGYVVALTRDPSIIRVARDVTTAKNAHYICTFAVAITP